MDKAQALHSFWSSFSLPAYDEASVPSGDDTPQFPYITYTVATDALDGSLPLVASLWYKSTSWRDITLKSEEIARRIETMERPIPIDNGYLWIVRGTPFAQRMTEPDDNTIRRILLNIVAEFLTPY